MHLLSEMNEYTRDAVPSPPRTLEGALIVVYQVVELWEMWFLLLCHFASSPEK